MDDLTRFAGTAQDLSGLLNRQQSLRAGTRAQEKKTASRKPIPKHQPSERFVRGPIPYGWLRRAMSCGGKAGNLAWAIWWLAGVKGSNPIRLQKKLLEDFHISSRTVRRVLRGFENAGLIELVQKPGRGPEITLLPLSEVTQEQNPG